LRSISRATPADLFIAGCFVSIAAAAAIMVELALLAIWGLSSISSNPSLYILWTLYALAIAAYTLYTRSDVEPRWLVKYPTPAGLVTVLAGLVMLTLGSFSGAWLVFIGYLAEPVAGYAVMLRASRISRAYGLMLYIGSLIYLAGLPLYLVGLPIIAIAGDTVKLAGFAGVVYRALSPGWPMARFS